MDYCVFRNMLSDQCPFHIPDGICPIIHAKHNPGPPGGWTPGHARHDNSGSSSPVAHPPSGGWGYAEAVVTDTARE